MCKSATCNNYKIFEAFVCNPPLEVRSVFLDISKAFDKVWHEGLLYKLKSVGISGELYNPLENYLSGRSQRVALNGQTSSWQPILAGAPQGSILGPLLFLIFINDLPKELEFNVKLFADDMSLFTIVEDKNESANKSIMTLCKSLNGLITGKYFLIQVLTNWPKRFYFQEKTKYKFIQPEISTICRLKEGPIKNT